MSKCRNKVDMTDCGCSGYHRLTCSWLFSSLGTQDPSCSQPQLKICFLNEIVWIKMPSTNFDVKQQSVKSPWSPNPTYRADKRIPFIPEPKLNSLRWFKCPVNLLRSFMCCISQYVFICNVIDNAFLGVGTYVSAHTAHIYTNTSLPILCGLIGLKVWCALIFM